MVAHEATTELAYNSKKDTTLIANMGTGNTAGRLVINSAVLVFFYQHAALN